MSLSSFSAEDKERAGLVHQPKVVNSKPYVVEPWTRKVVVVPDEVIKKIYWSISEVAGMFNVAPSLIRYWETEFEIIHPKKNRKGHRQFTEDDVAVVKQIHWLVKVRRFTIEGAKMELANGEN